MSIEIISLTGKDILPVLGELARLRVHVFRAWPYLYDGSPAYEEDYLRRYVDTPNAVVVAILDAGRLVGAGTGQPLADEVADFRTPFETAGHDPAQCFYLAESVLDPRFRGRGLGHALFDRREAHARALGFDAAAFCAVIRDPRDPRKPPTYRPLDAFWEKRGYAPVPGLTVGFDWPDLGDRVSSRKQLQVWMRHGLATP